MLRETITEATNDRLICSCNGLFCLCGRCRHTGTELVAVVHRAVSGGRSDTLALVAGIVTINLFWATCAILGIGMVFAVFPWLAVGVRLGGAAYLVWFGLRLITRAQANEIATAQPRKTPLFRAAFLQGVATNIANPKSIAFYAAVFSSAAPAPRFHADLLCHACYCGRNCDVLVRHSRARFIAFCDRGGVSSGEGPDRPGMRWCHRRFGNSASVSLANRPLEPV